MFFKLSEMCPLTMIEIISATCILILITYSWSQRHQTAKQMVLCQTRPVLLFTNNPTKQESYFPSQVNTCGIKLRWDRFFLEYFAIPLSTAPYSYFFHLPLTPYKISAEGLVNLIASISYKSFLLVFTRHIQRKVFETQTIIYHY